MYGTVSNQPTAGKANGVAALCGVAAVVAVAGLVGYTSQTTSLYTPAAVRPTTQISSVPVAVQGVARSPLAAANVVRSDAVYQPVAANAAAGAFQANSTFWPIAMGVTAMAAFFSAVMRRKQPALEPIAMAATSGERLVWFPGATPAPHLTGQYPGDRGFDPLGFSKDPKAFERMRISEVFHGRLAMLGVVGCLAPELLFHKSAWFDLSSFDLNRIGVAALQVIAPLEYWRGNGGFSWNGGECADRSYPGFDPLGLTTEDTKLREIKNGRLAMLAMAGFEVQYHITGKSPLTNLAAHLADPLHANALLGGGVAMFATTGHKEGLWFPGAKPAPHLTGEFPGDRGFDPLSLAADPDVYARMRLSEVFHGRLAMLGVAGCVLPELLGKGAWFNAGEQVDGVKVGLALMALAAPTEYWRGQGGFGWDKGTMDRSYPGFDPLKLTSDRNKVAEIKNGRLAMAAIAGFAAQAKLTGQSPFANLAAHLADPVGANIITSHTNLAMF